MTDTARRHKLADDLEVLAGALKLGGQDQDARLVRRAAKVLRTPPDRGPNTKR